MRNYPIIFILLSYLLSEPFDGLTLITSMGGGGQGGGGVKYSHLIDNEQNIINSWTHTTAPASIAYLFPDSILYVPCKISQGGGQGGGPNGGRFKKMDWEGNVIWDYTLSSEICIPHHDIAVLPNGNILSICSETKTQEEAIDSGILNLNGSMTLDMIVEIRPEENNEASIVWEWHFWDHLIQDVNNTLNNYGSLSENPQLLNINCQSAMNGGSEGSIVDWNHCNAISYNSILDQIVLSSRHMNEIFVIDHSTTSDQAASHSGGNSGKGGDMLYRWGNPQNYNRGNSSNHILDSQHGVNWIPIGYSGEGNFILFNNNHSNNSSAVLEIVPPINVDGLYDINDTDPFGPAIYSWIHQENFYSNTQSGAFRLPNGNTIITSTSEQNVFEVDNAGNIQWVYEGDLGTARAIKYPLDYLVNNIWEGDINNDGSTDVLDIVIAVNFVLSNEYNELADLNGDGVVNVLDIVQLVNIILNPNIQLPDECYIIPEIGPCDGICPTYYFNQNSNQCEEFITGCCGVEAFNTLQECQNTCE